MGKDTETALDVNGRELRLWQLVDKAAFPGLQGTAYFNNIAAKAVFFNEMCSAEYKSRQCKIIENAGALARYLLDLGYDVLTGGTDNHMVVVNAAKSLPCMTGEIARSSLEECGIVVDKVELPYEKHLGTVGNGLRLGTAIVTRMGMGPGQMNQIAVLMDEVLRNVEIISGTEYRIAESFKERIKSQVSGLCSRFAVP